MELSVCIEMIGREVPFAERVALAARAGYRAVEFWGWQNKDLEAIAAAVDKQAVAIAAFSGSSGKLLDPALRDELIAEVKASIETAKRLNCTTLLVTTGNERPGVSRQEQHDSIAAGLKAVAPMAEKAGITLVLEPLNVLVNHKGYYLSTSAEGFEIIRKVDSPAIRLLFDIYHQQITEGNVTSNMLDNLDLIGHLHLADVPGRHEPGTGELNYANILKAVRDAGYRKYAGLEFLPTGSSLSALQEVRQLIS